MERELGEGEFEVETDRVGPLPSVPRRCGGWWWSSCGALAVNLTRA